MKTIRPATPDDYDAILRLNSAAIPHVHEIDRGELKTLHEQSIELPVVEVDGEVAGFVILLDETAGFGIHVHALPVPVSLKCVARTSGFPRDKRRTRTSKPPIGTLLSTLDRQIAS